MPQQQRRPDSREEDRYKVTPGKVATGAAVVGGSIYGTKVGGAYRMRGAAKWLNDERMAAAGAKGFTPKGGGESAKIHRKLRPTADRWQTTFAGQRRIKTSGPAPTGHRNLWLHPTKSRASYDREVLERGIRNAPRSGKLYRGVGVPRAGDTSPMQHEHMSAWTSKPHVAEHYAGSAQMYSNLPGFLRSSRNVGADARHPRTLEHEGGRAFNLTPFASRYNGPAMKKIMGDQMPDEYLMGPGVYKALGGPMPSLSELGEISKAKDDDDKKRRGGRYAAAAGAGGIVGGFGTSAAAQRYHPHSKKFRGDEAPLSWEHSQRAYYPGQPNPIPEEGYEHYKKVKPGLWSKEALGGTWGGSEGSKGWKAKEAFIDPKYAKYPGKYGRRMGAASALVLGGGAALAAAPVVGGVNMALNRRDRKRTAQ